MTIYTITFFFFLILGDLLKKTKDGSLYRNSWPSLFLSPPGITSELHIDAFGSNFWMALFQGKKRYKTQCCKITFVNYV